MSYPANDIEQDKRALYAGIPEDGRTIGNGALMKSLGWDGDRYWPVRDALIEDGKIAKGVGRGGTVRCLLPVLGEGSTPEDASAMAAAAESAVQYEHERALWEPMAEVIRNDWASDRQDKPVVVEVTAAQGSRDTGGRWTRPDIVSVSVNTYAYLPGGKFLQVTTFEVKPSDAIDVTAVYEALQHRRCATHSYVLLHVPDDEFPVLEDRIRELCEVARSHGIGVVVAGDPSDYSTWEEREVAQRVEPDPARMDEFISSQLAGKRQIAAEVR